MSYAYKVDFSSASEDILENFASFGSTEEKIQVAKSKATTPKILLKLVSGLNGAVALTAVNNPNLKAEHIVKVWGKIGIVKQVAFLLRIMNEKYEISSLVQLLKMDCEPFHRPTTQNLKLTREVYKHALDLDDQQVETIPLEWLREMLTTVKN